MPNWLHSVLADAAGIRGREVIPRVIPVANPAPGAETSILVPGGVVWKVQSLFVRLATSAVVANRFVNILIGDSTSTFFRLGGIAAQTASTTLIYDWTVDWGDHLSGTSNTVFNQPFPNFPILGGWTISTLTSSIDVADQYSQIALYVLEIEETPYDIEVQRDLAQLAGSRSDAIPQTGLGY